MSLATAYVAIRPDTKGFGASLLRTVNADATKAGKDAGKKMGGAFSGGVRGLAASAGGALGVGLGVAAVGGFLKQSVGLEAEFGKTMNVLQATTGAPKKDMADLSALAKKMGADTVFSANDASKAMLELARGGMNAAAIKAGALKGTMTLAAAGELEMGDAASYIVKGLGQFNLGAGKSSAVAAALAGAANASSASVSDMGFALSQAGLAANSVGFSIQETTGILAAFSNNGLEGSDAGTSLKTMLSSLQPATANAAGAFHELGLMTEDGTNKLIKANGEYVSAARMADLLKKGTEGLTTAEANRNIRAAFGSDAQRAATILAKEGAAGIREMTKATSDQSAAQDMANANMKGTAGALERASGAYETLQLTIGQALAPVVQGLALTFANVLVPALVATVTAIMSVSGFISDNATAFKGLAIVIGTVVAVTRLHATVMAVEAAGGMLQYLKATRLVTAATKIWAAVTRAYTAVQWALNVALNANPLGLFVAAIALVAAGLVIAYKRSDTFRRIVDGAFNAVKNVALAVLRWFTRSFVPFFTDTIPAAFRATVGWVRRNWPVILAILTGPVGLATLFIARHWTQITNAFKAARNWVVGAFKRSWAGLRLILTDPVQAARNVFQNIFGAGGVLRTLFRNAVSAIGGIWRGIQGAMSGPVNWVIRNVINRLVDAVNWVSRKLGKGNLLKHFGTVGGGGGGFASNPGGANAQNKNALASGGVLPGYTPGKDVHTFHSATGGTLHLSGGEAVMRPEWTRAVGGARAVRRMNDAVRRGLRFAGGGVVWPTTGHLTGTYPGHDGVDINAPGQDYGNPIFAYRAGRITYTGTGRGYGQAVFEKGNVGPEVVYGHMSRILTHIGAIVRAGQVIGRVGSTGHSTGPHLHFGVPGGTTAGALALLRGATNVPGGGGGALGFLRNLFDPLGAIKRRLANLGAGSVPGGEVGRGLVGAVKDKLVDMATGWAGGLVGTVGSAIGRLVGGGSAGAKAFAQKALGNYGWGAAQWPALNALWNKESGWNPRADNPTSSAYGIPQALPGSKMASAGRDWRTNAATQIRWGLGYIKGRYGSPAAAWGHSQRFNWYDQGGVANGAGFVFKGPKPERVLSERQTETYDKLLPILERIERGGTGTGPMRIVLDAGGGVTLTGHIDNRIQGRRAQAATVGRQSR